MELELDKYKFKGSRILLHFTFWISYIVFVLLQYALFEDDLNYRATIGSLTLTAFIDIAAAYFTVYYLIPKYLFKRKYIHFGIIFLISAAIAILAQRAMMYYISMPAFYPEKILSKPQSFWHINPIYSFLNIYTVVGFFASVKLLKYWYKNQQIKTELENKNKTSELALLRTQLNPHFLFNTLNNIDSLILTKPQKASDAIIKLSDIMRFMLYDTSTDVVPLDKEINYLKSYISLQQMRLKDANFVDVSIEGNCIGKTIAPMMFIPFVENAFKHGQKNIKAPGITVKLECLKDSINFEVTNKVDETNEINKDNTAGIGLANTKRRLELLYPEKHNLEIKKENGNYLTRLKISY